MTTLNRALGCSWLLAIVLGLSACGGGGGGDEKSAEAPGDTVTNPPTGGDVDDDGYDAQAGGFPEVIDAISNVAAMDRCTSDTVSLPGAGNQVFGVITYDRVYPHRYDDFHNRQGLNYNHIEALPARGVVVEAVAAEGGVCGDTVLAATVADGDGEYILDLAEPDREICVQVRAQLYGNAWDVQVTDNTNDNAAYYLVESTPATPTAAPERNLHADDGWGGESYTGPRAAAPFAILDTVCDTFSVMQSADSGVIFPTLHMRWSENNINSQGSAADGDIGGAYFSYLSDPNQNLVINEIFLTGAANHDTDEYDRHVIVHELGHYVSINLAGRFDSPGGGHGFEDPLNLAVAFEEGWADAFAAMILDQVPAAVHSPVDGRYYITTHGGEQSFAFARDFNSNSGEGQFFRESSVFYVMYNLFDANNNGAVLTPGDNLSIDFSTVFDVIANPACHPDTEAMTSLFSFVHAMKASSCGVPARSPEIDELTDLVDVCEGNGVDNPFGDCETDVGTDLNAADILPVYSALALGSPVNQICSSDQGDDFDDGNKVSAYRYLRFTPSSDGRYRFDVAGNETPYVKLYDRGVSFNATLRQVGDTVQLESPPLSAGKTYVLEIAHRGNLPDPETATPRRECFDVSVETL